MQLESEEAEKIMKYDIEMLRTEKARIDELCIAFGLELEAEGPLKANLSSLLKTRNLEIDITLVDVLTISKKKVRYLLDLSPLSSRNSNTSPKQRALLDLYAYLTLIEGAYSDIVEVISFLLIQNDHDLYDPKKMRFVESYSQLEKMDLFVKMQFIEKHGFKMITKAIDRNLRNCIAHLDFLVDEEGNITNFKTGEVMEYSKKGPDDKMGQKFVYPLAMLMRVWFTIIEHFGLSNDLIKSVGEEADYIPIDDEEAWITIVKHRTGFIYNDFGSQYPGNAASWNTKENNKLHKTSCPQVKKMTFSSDGVPNKYLFFSKEEALKWLETNRKKEGYTVCKTCHP